MKKITNMCNKIYKYFSEMNLLNKLSLVYTIAIFIPAIIMGIYTYFQYMNNMKKEVSQNSHQMLFQIKEDIKRKMVIIEGVADNIAFNSKVQNLLYYGMEFTPEELNYYINSIAMPIEYALNFNGANIYQISVYFVNNTIPEYNNFLKEERIKDEEWLKNFKKSNEDEIWIYPAKSNKFDFNMASNETNSKVLKMAKKIKSVNGKYLGVLTIDILEEDIFSNINTEMENRKIFVVKGNNIIYPNDDDDIQKYIRLHNEEINNKEKGDYFYNNKLYSYETINSLNLKIISKTFVNGLAQETLKTSGYNILAIIIGSIILAIVTYFILKMLFSRLNQIVKVMEIVAQGNFNIKIPIVHRDEVGKISENFNILIEKINTLINDIVKKETAQKDAQLIALQYQINPHFIYNTIDIFRMKLELEGNYEIADSIANFGKMLRYNINRDSQYSTVKDEIEYVEKYISLQKLRYGNKINFKSNVPENIKDLKILRFILQPIVENSINHGMKESKKEFLIEIDFIEKINNLEIHVIDNGKGIDKEELDIINDKLKNFKSLDRVKDTDKNIGLENINTRIKLFYGEQYYIKMESVKEQYTKTIINIPYIQD